MHALKNIFSRKSNADKTSETKPNPKAQLENPEKPNILVAAIDFGTTNSGWAFSFYHDFKTDPTKGNVKEWISGSGTLSTDKTPTIALINPDGKTLKAFGYDAQNEYKDLIEQGEHKKHFYFERFKMMLHKKIEEKLDRTITLDDAMGRALPALDIFSHSIKFLMDDMLKVVNDRLAGTIEIGEILWVITVPAIWTDGAKQFMREAAVKAGISTEKVMIALEPEAASVFCRHLSVDKTVDSKYVSISKFPEGTRYIVLDAGGGTIDITVHEIAGSGVKEIKAASGGGWGGTMVDMAFESFLTEIFGQNIYIKFRKEQTEDWLDLWRDFEGKKRSVGNGKNTKMNLKIPLSLIDMFKDFNHQSLSLSSAIQLTRFAADVSFTGDKMRIAQSVCQSFFKESLCQIVEHLQSIIEGTSARAMLVVGGYAESPMLQNVLKTTFRDLDIIIPLGASSTVLRGALVYGHSPHSIRERVLKYTYGVGTTIKFVDGVHDERKSFRLDGEKRCDHVFVKSVEREQHVKVGVSSFTHKLHPLYHTQSQIRCPIYASVLRNPKYTDEDGCTLIGEMTVPLAGLGLSRSIMVSLTFSGTEIQVEGLDVRSGEKANVSLNFLG